jgi:peptide deformylase
MKLTRRVLHRSTKPVTFEYPWQNDKLAKDMLRFMRENDGIGLAANQIGIDQRVFVMAVQGWQRACFNPEIVECSQNTVSWDEGCLSFPGEHCIIKRPEWVDVRYQSADGEWHAERFAALLGRCFQHELDHLDGITMWDRYKEQNAEQSRN